MKHRLTLAGFALLLVAPLGITSPTNPQEPRSKVGLSAQGSLLTLVQCNGGERSVAIASTTSKQRVLLAMYVYDPHGNCIARDEYVERLRPRGEPPATDDAAAEWYPPAVATYTIELRNHSPEPCAFQMAIR
jgi:hypothetical protein